VGVVGVVRGSDVARGEAHPPASERQTAAKKDFRRPGIAVRTQLTRTPPRLFLLFGPSSDISRTRPSPLRSEISWSNNWFARRPRRSREETRPASDERAWVARCSTVHLADGRYSIVGSVVAEECPDRWSPILIPGSSSILRNNAPSGFAANEQLEVTIQILPPHEHLNALLIGSPGTT
jgi:hypothetical protein